MNRILVWGRSSACARRLIQHRGSQSSAKKGKPIELDEPDATASVDRSRVCAGLNYFQTGEDPPIREDGEYPDWLENIVEPVKSYTELSPDTKQYWRRFNKVKARQNNFASKQLKR